MSKRTLLEAEGSAPPPKRLGRGGDATRPFDLVDVAGKVVTRLVLHVPDDRGTIARRGDIFDTTGENIRSLREQLRENQILDAISFSPAIRVMVLSFSLHPTQETLSPIAKIAQALEEREYDHGLDQLILAGAWMSEPENVGHLIREASRSRSLKIDLSIGGLTSDGGHLVDEGKVLRVLEGLLPDPSGVYDTELSLTVRVDPASIYINVAAANISPMTTFIGALGRVVANKWNRIVHLEFKRGQAHTLGRMVTPDFAASDRLRSLTLVVTHDDVLEGSLSGFLRALSSNEVLGELKLDMHEASGLDEATTVALTTMLATKRSLTHLAILGSLGGNLVGKWFQPSVSQAVRSDLFLELGRHPTMRSLDLSLHIFTALDGHSFLRGRYEASKMTSLDKCTLDQFYLEDDSMLVALLTPSPGTGIRNLILREWESPNLTAIWAPLGQSGCPLMRLDIADTFLDSQNIEEMKRMLMVNVTLSTVIANRVVGGDMDIDVIYELVLNRELKKHNRSLREIAGSKLRL